MVFERGRNGSGTLHNGPNQPTPRTYITLSNSCSSSSLLTVPQSTEVRETPTQLAHTWQQTRALYTRLTLGMSLLCMQSLFADIDQFSTALSEEV